MIFDFKIKDNNYFFDGEVMELYKDSIPLEKSKKNILLRDDSNLEKVTFFFD